MWLVCTQASKYSLVLSSEILISIMYIRCGKRFSVFPNTSCKTPQSSKSQSFFIQHIKTLLNQWAYYSFLLLSGSPFTWPGLISSHLRYIFSKWEYIWQKNKFNSYVQVKYSKCCQCIFTSTSQYHCEHIEKYPGDIPRVKLWIKIYLIWLFFLSV